MPGKDLKLATEKKEVKMSFLLAILKTKNCVWHFGNWLLTLAGFLTFDNMLEVLTGALTLTYIVINLIKLYHLIYNLIKGKRNVEVDVSD